MVLLKSMVTAFLGNRLLVGVLALAVTVAAYSWHTSGIRNDAFEAGFQAAQEEAISNDIERAAEIRSKASSVVRSFGSSVDSSSDSGVRGKPDPNDTRGYRD